MYGNFISLPWKFGNLYYHTLCRRRAIAGWVAAEKKAQCTVQPLSKQGCEKSISVLSGWPDPNDAA